MNLGVWPRLGIVSTALWAAVAPFVLMGDWIHQCIATSEAWSCWYIADGPGVPRVGFGIAHHFGVSQAGLWGNIFWISVVLPAFAWALALGSIAVAKWVAAGKRL